VEINFQFYKKRSLNQDLNNNGTEILGRWQSTSPQVTELPRMWAGRGNFINLASAASTRFVERFQFRQHFS
jgi:hypothetical protein